MLVKVGVLVGCLYYIYAQSGNKNFSALSSVINWEGFFGVAFLVSIMMLINWYLEAVKWRICLLPITPISKKDSIKGVLSGLTLNCILPFTMGDFVGRVLGLPKNKRILQALLLNRISSLGITILFGLVGVAYLYETRWTFLLLFCLFLFLVPLVAKSGNKIFRVYSHKELLNLYLYSIIRYLVFSIQFFVLLKFFLYDFPWETFLMGIPVIFLIKTVAPSLLGAFGIREAAALWVFQPSGDQVTYLLAACLMLWLLNIIVPSLLGLVPLFTYQSRFRI